jgi:hypothetical protein
MRKKKVAADRQRRAGGWMEEGGVVCKKRRAAASFMIVINSSTHSRSNSQEQSSVRVAEKQLSSPSFSPVCGVFYVLQALINIHSAPACRTTQILIHSVCPLGTVICTVYINKINQTVRSGSGGGKTVLFLLLRLSPRNA